jgi:[ribosomal protein S18]-alanine N-acetyltransferase
MTGDFAVRGLGALDLGLAADLHGESFRPLGERGWTRQDMAELLASHGVTGFVLQEEGNDVGFALCRTVADQAELLTIAIRPDTRGRGGGRCLLRAVINEVRARGARTLFLEVGADNPSARALYERMGFRIAGRRSGYYQRNQGPPADALTMALALD